MAVFYGGQWFQGRISDGGLDAAENSTDVWKKGNHSDEVWNSTENGYTYTSFNRLKIRWRLWADLGCVANAIIVSAPSLWWASADEQEEVALLVFSISFCFWAVFFRSGGCDGLSIFLALLSCLVVCKAASALTSTSSTIPSLTSRLHKHSYWVIASMVSLFIILASAFVLVWCLCLMNMITDGYIYICTKNMRPYSIDAAVTTTTSTYGEWVYYPGADCSMIIPTGFFSLLFMLISLGSAIHVVVKILLRAADDGVLEIRRVVPVRDQVVGETVMEGIEAGFPQCDSPASEDYPSPTNRIARSMWYKQMGIFLYFVLCSALDIDSLAKILVSYFNLGLFGFAFSINGVTMRLAGNSKEKIISSIFFIAFVCTFTNAIIELLASAII